VPDVRFRMLGPLLVSSSVRWVPVAAEQQRIVLAILLVEAGRVVSTDRLIDEVWGDRPPPTAVNTMHSYVSRLRRLLGDGVLVTRGRGYALVAADEDIDATAFERMVQTARHERDGQRPDVAAGGLTEALALWRGPVLADVPASAGLSARVAQLEQLRLDAEEDRVGVLLDLDRHAEVVPDLQAMVDACPLRERRWEQLLVALLRGGRRADALQAYQRARRVLRKELGLEPGPRLRELQHAALSATPRLLRSQPAPPRVVPAQLPTDVAGFVGREEQVEQLDGLLRSTDDQVAPAVVISALAGMAGVGKTALAVRWAHRVRDRFPDGQLYANLRGYEAGAPLQPMEVLARFLAALGIPHEEIPVEVEEATALYRSLVAGKRVLVVLDNARDPQQVRPLLPGGPGCFAVVTSRDRLGGLVAREGAVRVDLDVLAPEEANSLLARLLGPQRVAREAQPASELAELCGYLPLALRIAAANLVTYPHVGIEAFVEQLRQDRLAALQLHGEPLDSVRVAFGHSYQSLPEPAKRLFCLIGLVPGISFAPEAAAALAEAPVPEAVALLSQLAGVHLVELYADGRCGLHDLLRRYAAERSATELSDADHSTALDRLYGYYVRSIRVAADHLYPEMLRLPVPTAVGPTAPLGDHSAALAWLDAERSNLVAAVTQAPPALAPAAWLIADGLRGYLMTYRYVREWSEIGRAGLAAAKAAGDLHGWAAAHFSLGGERWVSAHYEQAVEHYSAALDLSRRAGWADGEAATLGNLGLVYWTAGQLDEAAAQLTAALAVDERTGRTASRATNLSNLGLVHGAQGRPALAADRLNEALECFRRAGSLGGEASVLANLGETYHILGRLSAALDALHRALDINRKLGDRRAEGETMRFLAAVVRDSGKLSEALDLARSAATAGRDVRDGRCEAEALIVEASIQDLLGEHDEAAATYRLALDLAQRDGYRYTEAEALIGVAAAWNHAGRPERAAPAATTALGIVRSEGYRLLEGAALTALSDADSGGS
jgi:DNA-binding SARP family transcriptional activator/tetratricopeptide (TPR) repeat protein